MAEGEDVHEKVTPELVEKVLGAPKYRSEVAERKGEPDDARLLRPTLLVLVGDEGEDAALRRQAAGVARRRTRAAKRAGAG